jgi:hypothetical protein
VLLGPKTVIGIPFSLDRLICGMKLSPAWAATLATFSGKSAVAVVIGSCCALIGLLDSWRAICRGDPGRGRGARAIHPRSPILRYEVRSRFSSLFQNGAVSINRCLYREYWQGETYRSRLATPLGSEAGNPHTPSQNMDVRASTDSFLFSQFRFEPVRGLCRRTRRGGPPTMLICGNSSDTGTNCAGPISATSWPPVDAPLFGPSVDRQSFPRLPPRRRPAPPPLAPARAWRRYRCAGTTARLAVGGLPAQNGRDSRPILSSAIETKAGGDQWCASVGVTS